MENPPSNQTPETNGAPAPEVLQPRSAENAQTAATIPPTTLSASSPEGKKLRRRTYRPSHKATFIALGVVVAILAVNAVVLGFVLKSKNKLDKANSGQVSISSDVLNKIGVNKTAALGSSNVQLIIDPDTKFNGNITSAGDVSIAGNLKLTSKFNAGEAAIARLQAGNTSLSQLDVNGNTTLSALLLRTTLTVNGATTLQGAVTVAQLMTINNSLNVQGNVSIGGTLTTSSFTARNLASTSTLTIGGHIITAGATPNVGPGTAALGSNGTVAISGNDASGVVSINIGVGATGGLLANVAFKDQYATTPRVVISPVGVPGSFYITNLSVGGFSISVASGLPPGGYAINYIAQQ